MPLVGENHVLIVVDQIEDILPCRIDVERQNVLIVSEISLLAQGCLVNLSQGIPSHAIGDRDSP